MQAGETIVVYYDVDNLGTALAPASNTGIYLSGDSTITTSDLLLSVDQIGSISPGNWLDSELTIVVPDLSPGAYYIGVIPDYDNFIGELNELNNASDGVQFIVDSSTPPAPPPPPPPAPPPSPGSILEGDESDNVLYGGKSSDAMYGHGGRDTLFGEGGNDVLTGGKGNDALDGGSGLDVAIFAGSRSAYSVQPTSISGPDGTDQLTSIERLQFDDGNVALDLNGVAGSVAKILGAVFGPASVQDPGFVGIGLDFLDTGTSAADLMDIALSARLGSARNDDSVIRLLYANVTGAEPSAAAIATLKSQIDHGLYTQVTLAWFAADHSLNLVNIGFTGLVAGGLNFE